MSIFKACVCGASDKKKKKKYVCEDKVLDYRHTSLKTLPPDVFMAERTLEELYLDSNQLKELPRELFYCHELKILGLSDNDLTALPAAVASFTNLQTLDISKNEISDMPESIKSCKQLSVVDASINPMCRLPESVTQLVALKQLFLNDTFLEYLPANFGRLAGLEILELRENQLNTLPKSMARLTALRRLDIGQNDFSELPEVIGSLPNLTDLWFDNNKVKSIPPMVGNLKQLKFVDASKNRIDWVADEIQACTLMTDLHLSMNNLKELPETLGACKALQVLRLDDNALTHLPESTGGLTSLEELVASQNDLERLPGSIGLLRSLHTLHVDDNMIGELPPELGSCNKLKILTVSANKLCAVPPELGHISHLAVLNLCDNLIRNLPVSFSKLKLRALWLSDNQAKPLVQLQSETDPITGQKVLTNYMLPQVERDHVTDSGKREEKTPRLQEKSKSHIKFAFDSQVDKPGKLTRAPTPYPKELKALAKHARNLQNVRGDSQETTKVPEVRDLEPSKKVEKPTKEVNGNLQNKSGIVQATESVLPDDEEMLTVVKASKPKLELKEAKTVRSNTASTPEKPQISSSVGLPQSKNPETDLSSPTNSIPPSIKTTVSSPYANHAAAMKVTPNSTPLKSSGNLDNEILTSKVSNGILSPYQLSGKKDSKTDLEQTSPYHVSEADDSLTQSDTIDDLRSHLYENEETLDDISAPPSPASSGSSVSPSYERKLKKPPPYHVAAPMSKQASSFTFDGGSKMEEEPPESPALTQAEEECSSSSTDSGYGNDSIATPADTTYRVSSGTKDDKRPPSLALPHDMPNHMERPASVAVGGGYNREETNTKPRPGSLALAEATKNYNTDYSNKRPGSIAAPINTLGIPPAPSPTRATSHTTLSSPNQPIQQVSSYSVSNLNLGYSPFSKSYKPMQPFEERIPIKASPGDSGRSSGTPTTTGLISIIDQVTYGILEDGGSSMAELPSPLSPRSQDSGSISDRPTSPAISDCPTSPAISECPTSPAISDCPNSPSSQSSILSSSNGLTNFTQKISSSQIVAPSPQRPSSQIPQSKTLQNKKSESNISGIPQSASKLQASQQKSGIPSVYGKPKSEYNNHDKSFDGSTNDKIYSNIPQSKLISPGFTGKTKSIDHTDGHNGSRIVSPGYTTEPKSKLQTMYSADKPKTSIPMKNGVDNHKGISRLNSKGSNIGLSPKGQQESLNDSRVQTPSYESKISSYTYDPKSQLPSYNNSDNKSQIPSYSSTNSTYKNKENTLYNTPDRKISESKIPSLGSVGRSPSNLSSTNESKIPTMGSIGRSPSTLSNSSEKEFSRIPSLGSSGRSSSNLQRPNYGMSPSTHQAINTPGIPPLNSTPQTNKYTSNIPAPGSYNTPNTRTSTSKLPMPGSVSGIPSPNKSPSGIQAPGSMIQSPGSMIPSPGSMVRSPSPNNGSPWMFGQHKNARVVGDKFPVVIEKNPGLGFTISESNENSEDCIYVSSVMSGGPSSSALKPGDKILQVDGIDFHNKDLNLATSILNNTGTTVTMLVSRTS